MVCAYTLHSLLLSSSRLWGSFLFSLHILTGLSDPGLKAMMLARPKGRWNPDTNVLAGLLLLNLKDFLEAAYGPIGIGGRVKGQVKYSMPTNSSS